MPTQAETQVQKAVITAADNLASAGSLNAVQADKLVDYVVDLGDFKNKCRVERFRNSTYEIDAVGLGQRVAMAKSEALDPQKRRGVSHTKVSLSPQWITVPVEMSHQYKRENIEGDSIEDHIIRMMADALSTDSLELALVGNLLKPAALKQNIFPGSGSGWIADGFLGLQDGWSLLAEEGHIYDAAGANISPSVFSGAMQMLPEKYQRKLGEMRWLLPTNLEHKYNNRIAAREDSAGTDALRGMKASSFGIQRETVSVWGTDPLVVEHVTLNGTTAVQLANAPVAEILAVHPITLSTDIPLAPYVDDTDYDVVLADGTIARDAGGAIADGEVVKVTYRAQPQMILTNLNNLIIGYDPEGIRLLRDHEIMGDVHRFVMHVKMGVTIQNTDAVVKVKNIGLG
jgi:hypothetical protein